MEPLQKENQTLGGNIDRLSHLNDDILHHILSLAGFHIFDLVALGDLSKRWNYLWTTMPYLDIDINAFYFSRMLGNGVPNHHHTLVEKFRNFINWVLIRHGDTKLNRFKLNSTIIFFDNVQILRWLRVASDKNIQELDMKLGSMGGFNLPVCIAVNESLRVVKLTLRNKVMRVPSVVRLNQLRSIELDGIEFTDSDTLQRLFFGCPVLESLRLNDCGAQNFTFLDFSSARLKELIFGFHEGCIDSFSNFEIKVSCPNLIFFKYSAPVAMNYILENASFLETVWIDLYGAEDGQVGQLIYRILKKVNNVTVLNLDLNVVYNLINITGELIRCPTSFPKVRFLSLLLCTLNKWTQLMFLLLDHCPNLEVFTLVSEEYVDQFPDWDDEHWALQYEGIVSWKSHPHLKTIKFVDFKGLDYELEFLRFLLKNARCLENLEITWLSAFSHNYSSDKTVEKVLMFPKASSGLVVTFLNTNPDD